MNEKPDYLAEILKDKKEMRLVRGFGFAPDVEAMLTWCEHYDDERRNLCSSFLLFNHDYKPRHALDVYVYRFMKKYAAIILSEEGEDSEKPCPVYVFLDSVGYPKDTTTHKNLTLGEMFCRDWMVRAILDFDASMVHEISDAILEWSETPNLLQTLEKAS